MPLTIPSTNPGTTAVLHGIGRRVSATHYTTNRPWDNGTVIHSKARRGSCHHSHHQPTLGQVHSHRSKKRRVSATHPTIPQTSDDITQREEALVDSAALGLPQLVVAIILGSQSAALTASQIHKVQR